MGKLKNAFTDTIDDIKSGTKTARDFIDDRVDDFKTGVDIIKDKASDVFSGPDSEELDSEPKYFGANHARHMLAHAIAESEVTAQGTTFGGRHDWFGSSGRDGDFEKPSNLFGSKLSRRAEYLVDSPGASLCRKAAECNVVAVMRAQERDPNMSMHDALMIGTAVAAYSAQHDMYAIEYKNAGAGFNEATKGLADRIAEKTGVDTSTITEYYSYANTVLSPDTVTKSVSVQIAREVALLYGDMAYDKAVEEGVNDTPLDEVALNLSPHIVKEINEDLQRMSDKDAEKEKDTAAKPDPSRCSDKCDICVNAVMQGTYATIRARDNGLTDEDAANLGDAVAAYSSQYGMHAATLNGTGFDQATKGLTDRVAREFNIDSRVLSKACSDAESVISAYSGENTDRVLSDAEAKAASVAIDAGLSSSFDSYDMSSTSFNDVGFKIAPHMASDAINQYALSTSSGGKSGVSSIFDSTLNDVVADLNSELGKMGIEGGLDID